MNLHYKAEGAGVPLVVLHGLLGSADNWRSVSRHLSGYYQVFTVDLRNHGRSPHSHIFNYEIMSQDLLNFAEQHNLGSCFLLGHSMGGKVAMQFATDYPDRVEKLIIVDVAPKSYPDAHRPLLIALGSLDLEEFNSFNEVDVALSTPIPDAAVRRFLLKNLMRDEDKRLRWKIDLPAIIQNYDNLTRAIAPGQAFAKPTCFIRGAQSNYIDEHDLPAIRAIFPQADFVTVPNAGHWIHMDNESEFLKIVKDFLGR